MTTWQKLNRRIIDCRKCPRLTGHCRRVAREKRRAWADHDYWGRPVPNFGDAEAPILIVGLAPGAHGANRTGRMFTGDRSGDWLYRALKRAGLANQSESVSLDDGMKLVNCAVTAVCHCAPPDNRPEKDEISNCQPWLAETVMLVKPQVFVALGGIAWKSSIGLLRQFNLLTSPRAPKFRHGACELLAGGRHLLGSYHPSQQNTFTGRLTEEMLDDVFQRACQLGDVRPAARKRKKHK
jgi:uracil-DNA glycosylase family 4